MHFSFIRPNDNSYCVSFVFIYGLFCEVVFNSVQHQMMAWLTLQRGGFKNPVHTVMWEGFSTGYLNLELNCAGVY